MKRYLIFESSWKNTWDQDMVVVVSEKTNKNEFNTILQNYFKKYDLTWHDGKENVHVYKIEKAIKKMITTFLNFNVNNKTNVFYPDNFENTGHNLTDGLWPISFKITMYDDKDKDRLIYCL